MYSQLKAYHAAWGAEILRTSVYTAVYSSCSCVPTVDSVDSSDDRREAAAAAGGGGRARMSACTSRPSRLRSTLLAAISLFAAVADAAQAAAAGDVRRPLYLQAQAPIESRVQDLVSRMTTSEKVAQMLGDGGGADVRHRAKMVELYHATGVGSAGNQVRTREDLHAQNKLQAAMLNSSRLGIPIDFTAETLHSGGHAGCTVFPMPCLQGSSWNVSLVYEIGASNALQARASGTNHGLSPVINVATGECAPCSVCHSHSTGPVQWWCCTAVTR
eukprot:SAG22_NODE_262_length_13373_cov_11.716965_2_plen_273_part_00